MNLFPTTPMPTTPTAGLAPTVYIGNFSTPSTPASSVPSTPTAGLAPTLYVGSYSVPSTPASSVPSTPTGSVCGGDIHSGSLVRGLWSAEEHEQFLEGMKLFPKGPWRSIAAFIGTRSIKQVQTHAQKYQQKINRRQRGLRKQKKKFVRPEHRVDELATGCIIRSKNAAGSNASESPRSPSSLVRTHSRRSFSRMLTDKTQSAGDDDNSEDEIDITQLLEGLEPFPFTPVTCEELFAQDDRYQQDLQESMDLLLL